MVGWAKRNGLAELKRKNYNKWFNSLSPVKQQEIRQQKEEQWKKDRPKFIALMVFTCLFILSFCLAGSIIKLFIIQ